MRTTHDTKLSNMRDDLARARELTERAEYEEAKATLLKLRVECGKTGLRSAHVAWCLAIACDGLGQFAEALQFAREALTIDPLAIPYARSYELIVERLRSALGDPARKADDESTPKLYEMLLLAGEGDAKSHLAMARWHMSRGEAAQAVRILEAVVTLAPSVREAWVQLGKAAEAAGAGERAREAELHATALEAQNWGAVARG